MASDILHIKDSYYFEVPKDLWPKHYRYKSDFPGVWVRLDPQFQSWEAERLYEEYSRLRNDVAPKDELLPEYELWKHDHANEGKPFYRFLEEARDKDWFQAELKKQGFAERWKDAKQRAGDLEAFNNSTVNWSSDKIHDYNKHLSGKILIPQVFGGELRNLYQPESGFCISKFMVIEVVVALIMFGLFSWLARQGEEGDRPKGRLWNFLEVFVVFIRDGIAKEGIGEHDYKRFVPLLATIFFFILGCNLFGMLPWAGAPTGSWGVTLGLALVVFGTGVVCGVQKFGPAGYIMNHIPGMDLPFVLAIVIKPMLLLIELLGVLIKHLVLSIRLLANMVAGHIVLLAVMGLAFGAGAMELSLAQWVPTAVIAVVGSTLFSCLELFVAFLQAYVFTFLSALFIGAAIHHH